MSAPRVTKPGHVTPDGAKLAEIRRSRRMTQAEVAEKAGINSSTYGHMERSDQTTTVEGLAAVARVLNVPFELVESASSYLTRAT